MNSKRFFVFRRAGTPWLVALLALGSILSARAVHAERLTFQENFHGTSLNPQLTLSTPTGYSARVTGGELLFEKSTGAGNFTYAYATTTFQLRGDFTVDVRVRSGVATNGSPSIGLIAYGLSDVYFAADDPISHDHRVYGNFFSPGFELHYASVGQASGTLRMERVGNTITNQYDTGSGFVTVSSRTDPSLAADATIALIFGEESNNTGARSGAFDDLSLQADAILTTDNWEEFNGGFNPKLDWHWDIPGNNASLPRDFNRLRFTANALEMNFQGGHPYGHGTPGIVNMPNITIVKQPENWYLETAVSVDWSQVDRPNSSNQYIQADLFLFNDVDNYTYVGNSWAPWLNNGSVYLGGLTEVNAYPASNGFESGSEIWQGDANYVKIRYTGTPTELKLEYDRGNGWRLMKTITAVSTGYDGTPRIIDAFTWNYLTWGLEGKRIGLLAAGNMAAPVHWDYLHTNLRLAKTPPKEVGLLTVGFLSGLAPSDEWYTGTIVEPIITRARRLLRFNICTSDTLNADFFSKIDVFVFANNAGPFEYYFKPGELDSLVAFVNNGGTAYLGIDEWQNHGYDTARAFGFDIVDRQGVSSTAGFTDTNDPIIAGPFQPATTFNTSFYGYFDSTLPVGGKFLAATERGNVLAYRDYGAGSVYMFTDEVPLFNGGRNTNMLSNVLYARGAPRTAVITGKVLLEYIHPNAGLQTVTFTFQPIDGSSEPFDRTAVVTAAGDFRITDILWNSYYVHVKGAKWLAKNIVVDASAGDVSNVSVTLPAGDANNDNHIDLFDLGVLAEDFFSDVLSINWNCGRSDFNCDFSMDHFDLAILAEFFNTDGDP